MSLDLADAVAIAGGAADADSLPAVVPRQLFDLNQGSRLGLEHFFAAVLKQDRATHRVSIAITRSTGLAASVYPLSPDHSVILVPLGAIARIRVLARLLLRYWQNESTATSFGSPLDNATPDSYDIPPRLLPLFGPEAGDDQYWDDLLALDTSLPLDPAFEPDSLELVHVAFNYLISHEFGHVFHRHFDFLAHVKATGGDLSRARRGIELHADVFAARTAIRVLMSVADGNSEQSLSRGFLRLSYGLTMLYSMYDTHRKYIGAYDAGAYTHPTVRRELFVEAATSGARDISTEAATTWENIELVGWKRCLQAFQEMNNDVLHGVFGPVDPARFQLLQTIQYAPGAATQALWGKIVEARELLDEVAGQVQTFKRSIES